MKSLDQFVDNQLACGRAYFTRDEMKAPLEAKPATLASAITRLVNRHRLITPKHGLYLNLRAEDQVAGAPDPLRWIDPLMKYQKIDCRNRWCCTDRQRHRR